MQEEALAPRGGDRRRGQTRWLTGLLAASVSLGLLVPASASAAIIDVTREDDPTPDGCMSGVDCSLREAVILANGNAQVDTINLPAGVYSLTITGTGEGAAATGDLDLTSTDKVEIKGMGAAGTAVQDAASTLALKDRVFDVIGSATLSISDLTVRNGRESNVEGGAGIRTSGELSVERAVITNNIEACCAVGGGILVNPTGRVIILDSTISNNVAGQFGGGLSVLNTTTTSTIARTTFSGNSTGAPVVDDAGGGIAASFGAGGSLAITSSTITGNSAGVSGGGIQQFTSPVGLTIGASTVAGNSSPGAGNINAFTQITVTSSIVADPLGGGANCSSGPTIADGGRNLESANSCGFNTGTPDFSLINTNPLLAPLAANGGPTQTHGLFDTSPAINAIPNADCALVVAPTDQRGAGFPRPDTAGGACDIGAFEGSVGPVPQPPPVLQPPVLTPPSSVAPAKKKKCKKRKKAGAAKKCKKKR